ncbi:MAG: His/Gly/Thr/Pro-type tRNA ligase C-terminal domain-containing protein, partial [Bdellovibrionales bacterium]|nr:His/Gly/Thr/Pro-type tRNA ligase C-terminal domain-containing protein [Bdellovibrionales bacterium]
PLKQHQFDGPRENWLQAEALLREALCELKLPFVEASGEAAFYGPKIDVQMQIGVGSRAKGESIASVQLDFNSGGKFNLSYVDDQGKNVVPWIIHRAPIGSHERMVSLLLERSQGHLPAWLAPIQVAILPVDERHEEHALKLHRSLRAAGIRSEFVRPQGSLSKRLKRLHSLRPFSKLVLGDAELLSGDPSWKLSLRDGEHSCRPKDLVSFVRLLVQAPWGDY